MKTATLVRKLEGWTGDARHYRLSHPITFEDYSYEVGMETAQETSDVIVSATVVPFGIGPECFIFPATDDGSPVNYRELDGSMKGTLSHEEVLNAAGYTIAE